MVKGSDFERRIRELARRRKEIGRDLPAKMCADLKLDPHEL
jgi:hypothetical protein